MQENCECQYCKSKVNEYFCSSCGISFNSCESFFEFNEDTYGDLPCGPGRNLCPICHPRTWDPEKSNYRLNISGKIMIGNGKV